MRGLPYYEEPDYHHFLLSRERREMFPIDEILSQIRWQNVENMLDFGMGNGYFLPYFYKYISESSHVWGAECQELHIDNCLMLKVREKLTNFIPFYLERTEHPLLPDWIPPMELIFCSLVLSTFADPSLAVKGIGRGLTPEGRMIVLDWEKVEAPAGPDITLKINQDRMKFFIEDAGYKVSRTLKINPYVYGFEVMRDPDKPDTSIQYRNLE